MFPQKTEPRLKLEITLIVYKFTFLSGLSAKNVQEIFSKTTAKLL